MKTGRVCYLVFSLILSFSSYSLSGMRKKEGTGTPLPTKDDSILISLGTQHRYINSLSHSFIICFVVELNSSTSFFGALSNRSLSFLFLFLSLAFHFLSLIYSHSVTLFFVYISDTLLIFTSSSYSFTGTNRFSSSRHIRYNAACFFSLSLSLDHVHSLLTLSLFLFLSPSLTHTLFNYRKSITKPF